VPSSELVFKKKHEQKNLLQKAKQQTQGGEKSDYESWHIITFKMYGFNKNKRHAKMQKV
jgi:hypothetical protein